MGYGDVKDRSNLASKAHEQHGMEKYPEASCIVESNKTLKKISYASFQENPSFFTHDLHQAPGPERRLIDLLLLLFILPIIQTFFMQKVERNVFNTQTESVYTSAFVKIKGGNSTRSPPWIVYNRVLDQNHHWQQIPDSELYPSRSLKSWLVPVKNKWIRCWDLLANGIYFEV